MSKQRLTKIERTLNTGDNDTVLVIKWLADDRMVREIRPATAEEQQRQAGIYVNWDTPE